VPPIYQQDVAANAIVYALKHDRREIYVGAQSVKAIVGNKLFPGLPDHYLATKMLGCSVPSISGLFKWRQFEPEVILLAVGWYLRFRSPLARSRSCSPSVVSASTMSPSGAQKKSCQNWLPL
jgi:hypothetical protein